MTTTTKEIIKHSLLILTCLLLFVLFSLEKKKAKIKKELALASQDSLSFYKNKQGELVGRIQTLQSEKVNTFLQLETKDGEIVALQNLVKEYKRKLGASGSAGIIVIEGDVVTEIETVYDTIKESYEGDFNLENWVWGGLSIKAGNAKLSLSYRDSIHFVLGEERTGFLGLGKRVPFSDVISKNPYNSITSYRTYQVIPVKRTRIGIGPIIGTGYAGPEFTPVFVGFGVQYCVICL